MDAVPTVTVPITDTAMLWLTAHNTDVGQSILDLSAMLADVLHLCVFVLGMLVWYLMRRV